MPWVGNASNNAGLKGRQRSFLRWSRLLTEDLAEDLLAFSPQALADPVRPASLWRIQRILMGALSFVVLGLLSFEELNHKAVHVTRYLFDSPRSRLKQPPQAVQAALQLGRLS